MGFFMSEEKEMSVYWTWETVIYAVHEQRAISSSYLDGIVETEHLMVFMFQAGL